MRTNENISTMSEVLEELEYVDNKVDYKEEQYESCLNEVIFRFVNVHG